MRLPNKRQILAWAKGALLFPYYSYMTYWRCRVLFGAAGLEWPWDQKDVDREIHYAGEGGGEVFVKENGENIIRVHGVKILLTGQAARWTCMEVIAWETYNFSDPEHKYIVLDIGGNVGITALFLAKKENVVKVFTFEPMQVTFQELKKNLELNPELSPKIEPFQFGIGGKDEIFTVPYSAASNTTTSYVFPQDVTSSEDNVAELEVRDAGKVFRSIIEENKNTNRIFMKVDCEGAEFDIIPRLAETGCLSEIDAVIMEFHRKSPAPLIEILNKNGFFVFAKYATLIDNGRGCLGMIEAVNLKKQAKGQIQNKKTS
jgi:FkbM family methyltransferase